MPHIILYPLSLCLWTNPGAKELTNTSPIAMTLVSGADQHLTTGNLMSQEDMYKRCIRKGSSPIPLYKSWSMLLTSQSILDEDSQNSRYWMRTVSQRLVTLRFFATMKQSSLHSRIFGLFYKTTFNQKESVHVGNTKNEKLIPKIVTCSRYFTPTNDIKQIGTLKYEK